MRHWLPKTVTKGWPAQKLGRGAPRPAGRTVKACKRCKKAKHKCDDSRPCGRCIFMQKQAECIEEVGQQEEDIAADSPAGEGQHTSRPAGGEGAAFGTHVGAGLADGDESLVAAVPGMEVVSLSPALARRYQLPFGDLVGTQLLVWVVEDGDGHEKLLAAIASVLDGRSSKSMELVSKMYVQR